MITAADLMTRDVLRVTPDMPIADVAQLILKHGISSLPVVDADRRLVGIVSEGDLIRRRESGKDAHRSWWLVMFSTDEAEADDVICKGATLVGEVMSKDVLTASPGESLSNLVAALATSRIKRLPIVEHRRLVGIVSRVDLLRFLVKDRIALQELAARG